MLQANDRQLYSQPTLATFHMVDSTLSLVCPHPSTVLSTLFGYVVDMLM